MKRNSGRGQHSIHQEKEENEWVEHRNSTDGISLYGSAGENETVFGTASMYNEYENWRFCGIFSWE
jgi:hypothetical protein